MVFRRAARKDANHVEIVAAFRKAGWYVLDVAQLKNCCDIIISKNGRTIAVEIKDGTKPPSQRKLSKGEEEFRQRWKGEHKIVLSVDDVLKCESD